ncbi:MAG: hypothetical protein RL685_2067 [Pseudomonadota bacterium]|jgi:hypothetical protein
MNSALTINQILGAGPEAQPLFLLNSPVNDLSELSDEQLATIHGGEMTAFETAATFLAAGALIVSGAGVLATLGYATAALVTGAVGVGVGVGGAGGAMYGGD